MKLNAYLLIAFVAFSPGARGQAEVEVTLTGVKAGNGSLRVGLFTEGNFLKTPIEGKIVKASSASIVLKFENVRDGDYALSVIHDTNDNGELDKSKLGIPKEGFAFSNNVMGKKGPPAYQKAKFEVKGTSSVKQELVMRYP
ncbi:MAG TPA: DUF2141 domain-containing protein [Chryseolinea sp.]|nr:DUF2141 domain-containing protein [Chryseolinea sp.]